MSSETGILDKDGFISSYVKLPEKAATTIRFFDRGERYSVYGPDAIFAAQELSGMKGGVKKLRNPDSSVLLEYYNINRTLFDTFIRDLLLVKQYRVEVWINKKGGWVAEFKGSPGNLTQFEDLLFSNSEVTVNNGVIGIKLGTVERNKMVGIGHVNMNEYIMNLIEFVDNDSLTNFESVLVQLAPKEAVIGFSASQTEEAAAVKKILERNNVLINERKPSDFDTKDMTQDLTRLLKLKSKELQNVSANPELEKKIASASLAGVIKYLELLSNESYFNQFKLQPFDFGLYLKMDSAACQALHLTQSPNEGNQKSITLSSIIDNCRTAQGHRLHAQYLRQPLVNKDKLEERYDLVEIFVEDIVLREVLYEDHLRRVPDCQSLARKFLKKKASLQDCYKSYLCLTKLPKLISDLEGHSSSKKKVLSTYFIDPLNELKENCSKFVEMIETTLDLSLADQGEFMIRPDFDEGLQELRNEMDFIKTRMDVESRATREILKLDDKALKLETTPQYGFHFRVTLKDEKSMRESKKFTILDSSKAGVKFRSEKLESLNDQYSRKLSAYDETQTEFKEELMVVAADYHNSFEQLGNILAALDVFISFATVSSSAPIPYTRPILHAAGTGLLSFEQLRHPIVESQNGVNFIPNDIEFKHDKKSFFIVTGPNMGGKSTFLRSVGVATLLAHIGCFVPAAKAELSIVDAILARVGASDSLVKGVSTFMAEMIETAFILKTATKDSLVLIDELGRGTSTYDGFGLCWAISEHLAKNIGCFTILATHFHELTNLAEEVSTVANLHVTALADESGLAMLYKIEPGACDRSFGLHVAKVTKFPPDVIETAKIVATHLEDFSSDKDQDDTEAGVERRRKEKKDGEEAIDNFMEAIAELRKNVTDQNELQAQESKLLEQLRKSNNAYIEHILSVPPLPSFGHENTVKASM